LKDLRSSLINQTLYSIINIALYLLLPFLQHKPKDDRTLNLLAYAKIFTDKPGNIKGGSITVPLTSYLTSSDIALWFGLVCFANKNNEQLITNQSNNRSMVQ